MYLLVTIDTEEDMPRWRPEKDTTVKNISAMPALHKRLTACGARPTYLVNRPVIEDDSSCRIISKLNEDGGCEIGMHLHAWNTPPLNDDELAGKATYLNALPPELQHKKIIGLHHYFSERLGVKPTSYRAGRYGFGLASAQVLASLDFEVDSSIVPFRDYSADGGPDYAEFRVHPFFIRDTPKAAPLLEVPLTVDLVHPFPDFFTGFFFSLPNWTRLRGILNRLNVAKILQLRPTSHGFHDMRKLADHLIKRTDVPVLNIMFHSSECFPGASPYNRNDNDVSHFVERLCQIVNYLISERGLKGITLTDFARLVREKMSIYDFPVGTIA